MRLLTYNIRHGTEMRGRRRLREQAEVIRASGADVVFLQEVDLGTRRGGRRDLTAVIAEYAGLAHWAFGATDAVDDGEFGNAILSRLPLESVVNHPIPAFEPQPWLTSALPRRGHRRGILDAAIRLAGAEVRLLCTHFGFLPGEAALGARTVLGLIQDDRPLVPGGDLNASRQRSECHRILRTRLTECAPPRGRLPATFPAPWPRLRLDYLYSRGLRVDRASVLAVTASDHRPVLCDVAIP